MLKPDISIIIPALNEEKYIEGTLKSIKNQDYSGTYEIIVADGNSTDKTLEISKKYANLIVIEPKKGPSAARNSAAKKAKGDILVFVDADTHMAPNFLATADAMFKNQEVVAASNPILPLKYNTKNMFGCWLISEILLKQSITFRHPYLIGNSITCRKKAFDEINGFDENLTCLEDLDFAERVSKRGKIKFMKDTFVLTSTRRADKSNNLKMIGAWPFGLIGLKLFKKVPKYEPVR